MEGAEYIIRLDDACPTQDSRKWQAIERILSRHGVRPIVALVPANEDVSIWFAVRLTRASGSVPVLGMKRAG